MKLRFAVPLLCLPAFLLALKLPAAGPAQPAAEIVQLVVEASAYQSGSNAAPLRRLEDLARQSVNKPGQAKRLEAGLIALLSVGSTYEARRFACQQLAIVGSDASLPALGELLKSDETVGIACLALSTHPSAKANATLRSALASTRGLARVQIIQTLGDRRDGNAVSDLTPLARDADPATAEAAVVALGKIATAPARAALMALRRDAPPALAAVVTEALLRAAEQLTVGDPRSAAAIYESLLQLAQPVHVRRGAFAALLRLDKDGGELRIFGVLRGSDPVLRAAAIAAVRALKSREASAKFARALPNLQAHEQVWMIEALADRADAPARAAITAQLKAEEAAVRMAAMTALGRMGNASSVTPLLAAWARAGYPEERAAAEQALATLRAERDVGAALLAELKTAPPDAKARVIAILARRGERAAVPALLELTAGPATARAAFQALGKLAAAEDLAAVLDQLVNLKVADAREDAESALISTLARVADAKVRAGAVCGALARATEVDTRRSLLSVLPACGCRDAFAALEAATADAEPRVRDTAIRALADWPDAMAWDALAKFYRAAEGENAPYRVLALRALVRLAGDANAQPDATLMDRYRQLLSGARGDDDRKLILSALAGAAHPAALQLAVPLLANPGVRAETELAVKKIAESIQAQHPQAAKDALERLQAR